MRLKTPAERALYDAALADYYSRHPKGDGFFDNDVFAEHLAEYMVLKTRAISEFGLAAARPMRVRGMSDTAPVVGGLSDSNPAPNLCDTCRAAPCECECTRCGEPWADDHQCKETPC